MEACWRASSEVAGGFAFERQTKSRDKMAGRKMRGMGVDWVLDESACREISGEG